MSRKAELFRKSVEYAHSWRSPKLSWQGSGRRDRKRRRMRKEGKEVDWLNVSLVCVL
jgi:hypothetical protein